MMRRTPKRRRTDDSEGVYPSPLPGVPSLLPQGSSIASSFLYHRGMPPEIPDIPDFPETQQASSSESIQIATPQESPTAEPSKESVESQAGNESFLELEYEPLLDSSQIRLARIAIDASRKTPLYLQLKTFDKASVPPYTAITYAWQTTNLTERIKVNGKDVLITESLHQFLVEARYRQWECSWNGSWLWLDSLSINQNNNGEKNALVPTMTDIYDKASEIIAWLGNLPKLHQACSKAIEAILRGDDPKELLNGRSLKAVLAFAESPWWSRAWVVQEASTPTKDSLELWYGTESTYLHSWSEVRRSIRQSALQQLADPEFHEESHASGTSMRASYERMVHFHGGVFNQVKRRRQRGQAELLGLLEKGRQSHSTNPRDKVYAFVSIAQDKPVPKVRYESSLLEVYTDVVRFHLEHKKNLDILSHSFPEQRSNFFDDINAFDDTQNPETGLESQLETSTRHEHEYCPTWIPDWSARPVVRTFPRIFRASVPQPLDATILPDGLTLRVRGLVVDSIEAVCDAVPGKATGFPLQEWVDFATEFARDESHRTRLKQTFGRVLCADTADYRNRGHSFKFENDDGSLLDSYKMFDHTQIMTHIGTGRRKLLKTAKERLGLGLYPMEPGDTIVVLFGGRTPFILRQLPDSHRYRFVSELYLDGVMDGEAIEGVDVEQEAEYFEII